MAKKFGKRAKSGAGKPAEDPRDLFGAPQLPRHAARPASSTPLADQLNRGWPGVDPSYVVLPRSIAESMSLPWQQQMAALLDQFHQEHARLNWPIYRVTPSRYEKLVDLDEEQLAEAGYLVEIDTDGEMVYRERSGRKVEDPRNTTVLVSCLDPIPRPAGRPSVPPPVQSSRPPVAHQPPPRAPAAMNIGPAPVWRTVTPPAQPPPAPLGQSLQVGESTAPSPPSPPASTSSAPPVQQPLAGPPTVSRRSAPNADTPPRGNPAPPPVPSSEPGWFDDSAGRTVAGKTGQPAEGDEFGPTGAPTEARYRAGS